MTESNNGLIPEFSEKSQKRHINSARPGRIGPGNGSFEVGKDITDRFHVVTFVRGCKVHQKE